MSRAVIREGAGSLIFLLLVGLSSVGLAPTAALAGGAAAVCVNNSTGTTHVIGSGQTCASGEVLIGQNDPQDVTFSTSISATNSTIYTSNRGYSVSEDDSYQFLCRIHRGAGDTVGVIFANSNGDHYEFDVQGDANLVVRNTAGTVLFASGYMPPYDNGDGTGGPVPAGPVIIKGTIGFGSSSNWIDLGWPQIGPTLAGNGSNSVFMPLIDNSVDFVGGGSFQFSVSAGTTNSYVDKCTITKLH